MVGRIGKMAGIATAFTVLFGGIAEATPAPHQTGDASAPSSSGISAAKVRWHPRFRFTFDQGESLAPGTRVVDATGHGHYGVVRVSGPGRLKIRPGVVGKAAGYPRRGCKGCGRAIIKIRRNAHLNPWRHPFSFGATVRVRPKWAKPHRDPNILQKGLWSRRGTQWKLQLDGARPSCVFNGTKGRVDLVSPTPIDDGKWHRLVCRRVGRVHTLLVDGVSQGTASERTGQIADKSPVTVGGRAVGTYSSNDQFHGNVDNVFLRVGTKR
jgi:Laminin G domain